MNQYEFKQIVFTPKAPVKLKINGIATHLPLKQVKLLQYMLDNAGEVIPNNTIIDDVWGPGSHTYNALSIALHELNKTLPEDCRVKNVLREGYIFEHPLTITDWRFEGVEKRLQNSPQFNKYIKTGLFLLSLLTAAFVSMASINFYDSFNRQMYTLSNVEPLFTWDYFVGTPQISPDGRYLALRLSKNLFSDDYLGLFDLELRDTKRLVPMGFTDGFEWNLTGDKIVYQDRTSGLCKIKLLSFDDDKNIISNEPLTNCDKYSGQLSFAWYSDTEFYVNFVADGGTTSLNGLPLHHLHSFNIETKRSNRLETATFQGGVGFYSLEYDPVAQMLYMLQSYYFKETDFYRYDGKTLSKMHRVDYEVKNFTVHDNHLVYKNQDKRMVINAPPDNFRTQQVLIYPQPEALRKPHLMGDRLVYLAGETFDFTLHKIQNEQIVEIDTNKARVTTLEMLDDRLIFTSAQTGIYQVYVLLGDGNIKRISDNKDYEFIKHLSVVDDILAISHPNRVDIFQYRHHKLTKLKSLKGVTHGVIAPNGKTILLKTSKTSEKNEIVERRLSDYGLTGVNVDAAKLAFYHQGQIVFLSHDNVLMRLNGNNHQVIKGDVNAHSIEYTDVADDNFYYVRSHKAKNKVICINLITGDKTEIPTFDVNPTKIQWVNNSLYIRAYHMTVPDLFIGDLTSYY